MLSVAGRFVMMMFTVIYTFLAVGSCAAPAPPPQQVDLIQEGIPVERPAEEKVLTILQSRGEISQTLQQAAELYTVAHPEVQIRIQTIGGEDSYKATLRARLLAGEQVDLFHIFGHREVVELGAHLDDLSDLEWAMEPLADTLGPMALEGGVYGIPYSVEGMGLIANRKIFEGADIPIASTFTAQELEDAFKALRELITLGELREDFPELEAVTELPGQDYAFLGRQLADVALGGEFASAAQAAGATSIAMAGGDAFGRYIDLTARYATNGRGWQGLAKIPQTRQVENGLALGRVAVIQQELRAMESVVALDPDLERHLRLLPIPLEEEEPGYVYTHAPAYWAINENAAEASKELARDFLTWLYTSETGATIVASRFGALSPYRETAMDTGNPLHRQLLAYIEQDRALPRYFREYPEGWGSEDFGEAVREYFTATDYQWSQALGDMKNGWTGRRIQP